MKFIFWLVICVDVAVLLLFFVLGLAAAPSSKTSPLAVAGAMLVIPAFILSALIVLFLRAPSSIGRIIALILAASPLLVAVLWKGVETAKLGLNMNSEGKLTFFRAGPARELSEAITSNDAAAVARLVPQVDINSRGYMGMTPLMLAFRQLRETPERLEVLRAVMKASPDPNLGTDELPLEVAIQVSSKAGPEPVMLLLAAGANPNKKTQWSSPVWFGATGKTVSIDILKAMLDQRADLNAQGKPGQNAVFEAAICSNWKAVMLLLQRGADWRQVRNLQGLGFKEMIASDARVYGGGGGLAEVIEYMRHQ